jgi:hypothetical protein
VCSAGVCSAGVCSAGVCSAGVCSAGVCSAGGPVGLSLPADKKTCACYEAETCAVVRGLKFVLKLDCVKFV